MEDDFVATREYWEANRPATMGDVDKLNRRIDELYDIIKVMRDKDAAS